MKFYIILFAFCVALVKSDNVEDQKDAETILKPKALPTAPVVRKMIEDMRDDYINKGWNDLQFNNFELPINLERFNITGNVLATGRIQGLLGFEVKRLTGLLTYIYELEWGTIDVNIEPYDLQGFVHMIQVFGKGKLSVKIENLNVAGKFVAKYRFGDSAATIKSINVGLTLPDGPNNKFEITGWLNDEAISVIITKLINENMQAILKTFKTEIDTSLSAIVMDLLKDIKIPVS